MALHFSRIAAIQLVLALPAFAALSDGLAAYYDFETDLQDKSGNNRNLINAGGTPEAAWNGGTVTRAGSSVVRNTLLAGKALNLVDVDGDALKIPVGSGPSTVAAGSFNLGGSFTISMWHLLAPLPSNTSTRYFLFEGEGNYDISWGTTAADNYKVYNAEVGGTAVDLTRGTWHHVVNVFEKIGDTILLTAYVDGAEIGKVTADAATMDFNRIVLGGARTGQDRKWDGLIDEVSIWNRALTSSELKELDIRGNAGIGVTEDPAVHGKAYLDVATAQPLSGSVTGSGLYNLGQQVTITAQAAPGYNFDGWTGGFASQPATFPYVVAGSVAATASFSKDVSDSDGDGLSAYDEITIHGTNPLLKDTDGDGIPDGDEINHTGTSPTQSDTGLLARADAAFGPSNTGGIAISGPTISRNPADGVWSLVFGLNGSTDRIHWTPVPIAFSGVSVLSGGNLLLSVPAPSPAVSTYEIRGSNP